MTNDRAPIRVGDLVDARYRRPTTLRTRATGTPFRVVARGGTLIVVPGSGIERSIQWQELERAWPLIAAGATKSALKTVTNNASYIEAVFDDIGEATVPAPSPTSPRGTEVASEVARAQLGAAAQRVTLLEEEVRDTRSRLEAAERVAVGRITDLRAELRQAQSQVVALERRLASRGADDPAVASTLRRYQHEAHRAGADLRNALEAKEAANERAAELAEQVKRLQHETHRVQPVLTLRISEHAFTNEHPIRPELWEILYEAGQLAFKFPSASVANSRRAMESAIGHLWRQATGGIGTPKMNDMLEQLRGHRLMPNSDWHLVKNLYSRASAIVHDGTKRADLALWIFFGAVQICELVQRDEDIA